jgi:hypothetical protein
MRIPLLSKVDSLPKIRPLVLLCFIVLERFRRQLASRPRRRQGLGTFLLAFLRHRRHPEYRLSSKSSALILLFLCYSQLSMILVKCCCPIVVFVVTCRR